MKKIKLILLAVTVAALLTACGESKYDRDFKSGLDKFKSGDVSSMSKSERKAVNDFLNWSSKN